MFKRSILFTAFVHSMLLGATSFSQEALPYKNRDLSLDERVADLVARLTLEEKAQALNHVGPTLRRFNLRSDQWNQCLNGVKWDRPTTLFPVCIGMAATWNTDLVKEVASVTADEARAIYNGWHLDPKAQGQHKGLIYRAPVINVGRNPYWGRNHEAWGEDSFLTGRMGVAYVSGLQGDDPRYLKIAATLKHYAVNNVEVDRKKLNAHVSERMLREYWLPHFRDAVVEGKASSLMASYNAINGTPNNINQWLLTDVLKNEWKHEGFVVSDLGGVKTMVEGHAAGKMDYVDAIAQSVTAGCDFSDKEYQENIPEAVRQGKLSEARLNDAVARVMRVRMHLGEFDPFESVPYSKIPPSIVGSEKHRALALRAAQQSIVLLQNRGGLLPLDQTKLKRLAVIGPLAEVVQSNNYFGRAKDTVNPLQGLKDRLPVDCEIVVALGGEVGGKGFDWKIENEVTKVDLKEELRKAVEVAKNADAAVVFIGTTHRVEHEGKDRETLGLTGNQQALVEAVMAANPKTVVVEMSAGPLTVPWIQENVPAILQAWWPGEEGGHAIADVLLGSVNPSGRLPHTVYASEAQVPPMDEYDISKGFTYMYLKGRPLFPFGHGLSYSTFDYSNIQLSESTIGPTDSVKVRVDVRNTGKRAGAEIVQMYVSHPESAVIRPAKELRGFSRVMLEPGQTQTVELTLSGERLRYWDESVHAFVMESAPVEVLVGGSSEDIKGKATLKQVPR